MQNNNKEVQKDYKGKGGGGRNYNVKLQRNCKVTKKLKTIKKETKQRERYN